MEQIVCDDCGDVVKKEDDLNEGLCSECLKKQCQACGDVQMDEDDLNEDGTCYSCLEACGLVAPEKSPQEWLDEWYNGTKYKLTMNDRDSGCVIASVGNAGDYETHEINLNYGGGAENSMEFGLLTQSFWSEFDEDNFDETVASLDCTWDELLEELKSCLPPDDYFNYELWPESLFSIQVNPHEAISIDELPTLEMMNDCFREMKQVFDSHKK